MAKTVMVVDDDEHLMHVVTMYFELEGYNIVRARSGQEALDQLAEYMPDIMLLDVMMDGIDGEEVCRRVRADKRLKEMPILVFTAADSRLQALREAGADRAIAKPYSLEGLGEAVRELIRQGVSSQSR